MTARILWIALGCFCVVAATIGVALPLLPTTPFLLLAAYAFARSSPRLHRWLLAHKRFGPMIENWRRYGAIDRKTKIYSIGAMVAAFAASVLLGVAPLLLLIQAVVLAGAGTFVLTRPTPPANASEGVAVD